MKRKQKRIQPIEQPPLVVATVHTRRGLQLAEKLVHDEIDLLEVRLDCLADHFAFLDQTLSRMSRPLLLTARHPLEGGTNSLSQKSRRASLLRFLPLASAVDVELRSVAAMAEVVRSARADGKTLVLSFHDFQRTPSVTRLRAKVSAARRSGADVVKIATTLNSARDLATLILLQSSAGKFPLATMGMGSLGRVSRLALAAAGSQLNYGYLDRPQVAGQWPAPRLHALIREMRS